MTDHLLASSTIAGRAVYVWLAPSGEIRLPRMPLQLSDASVLGAYGRLLIAAAQAAEKRRGVR